MATIESKMLIHMRNAIGDCVFRPNSGVECDKFSNCDKCGWNPAVEEERKKKIREEFK